MKPLLFSFFLLLLLSFSTATAAPADSLELQKVTFQDTLLLKAVRQLIQARKGSKTAPSAFSTVGVLIVAINYLDDNCLTYIISTAYDDYVLRKAFNFSTPICYGIVDLSLIHI